ncbi:MAG: hypothetical protein JRE82_16120 [Deltaproteobacteria bacterium]|nr:hypothetical protein [Deltaproteobacteria bacterium]MBW2720010.1 hypothetical protein [Deltaproteobacteria bacterium]
MSTRGPIRSFVFYLLSCNLSELITVGIASAINAPLPILPMQILFLNLVLTLSFAPVLVGQSLRAVGQVRRKYGRQA